MTRTLHTKMDIAEEDAVAAKLRDHWDCSFNRYPQMFVLDWWISSGDRLKAFAEMKRRYNDHSAYPTVYLSFAKWAALLDYSTRAGVDGLIIYAFNDGIWYAKASEIDGRSVKILGRRDRNDVPTDMEPIIEVPIEQLTSVNLPAEKSNEEWMADYDNEARKTKIEYATLPRDERGNDPNDFRDDPDYIAKINAARSAEPVERDAVKA